MANNDRLNIDLDISGLEDLADAFANAPELVLQEAEQAGYEAIPILGNAIANETNIDTRRMLLNNRVSLEGAFNIEFSNPVEYAKFVNDRFHFVERGTEIAQPAVDRIYDRSLDRLAETFALGGFR